MVSEEKKEEVLKYIRKNPAYPSRMRTNLKRDFPELSYSEILETLDELEKEGKIVYRPYTRVEVRERYEFKKIETDSETGHTIYWDPIENNYALRHKRTGKVLRRSKRIRIDYTVSIETGKGHSVPFYCEVSASTMLVKKSADEVKHITEEGGEFQSSLDDYFHSKEGFDQIKSEARKEKEGVAYRFGRKAPRWKDAEVYIEKKRPRKYDYGPEEVDLSEY